MKRLVVLILIIVLTACSPAEVVDAPVPTETPLPPTSIPTATSTATHEPTPIEPSIPEFKLSDYVSIQDDVNPEIETEISLDDGAAIIIPANTFIDTIQVRIERNPEKINTLPPMEGNIIQLSDFYNFEVSGDLLSPVDLIIPFDSSIIPEGQFGILTVAIPTDNGWEYVPVNPEGGGDYIRIYTDRLGDPLIAWHFTEVEDRTLLSELLQLEDEELPLLCKTDIELSVVPENGDAADVYKLIGRVVPLETEFVFYYKGIGWGLQPERVPLQINNDFSNAAGLEVRINIKNDEYHTTTDEYGNFTLEFLLEDDEYSDIPVWWVKETAYASATCSPWPILINQSDSRGSADFYFYRTTGNYEGYQENQEQEVEEENMIAPDNTVETPELVGLSFNDAKDELINLGFGYTWIDGSSTYSLGDVYNQSPSAGEYHVPHRTTILLYRTTEQDFCSLEGIWEGHADFAGGDETYRIRISGSTGCNYTGHADTGGYGWTCSFDMIHQDKNEFYYFENDGFVIVSDTVAIKCGWSGYLSVEDGKIQFDNNIILEQID